MISSILQIAVHAPSGENCQPWRFRIEENVIYIFNIPERDTSLYSWGQCASYFAHGALIENISIAALRYGYTAVPILFPKQEDSTCVARILLTPASVENSDPLVDCIMKRSTNRKPYASGSLSSEEEKQLLVGTEMYKPAHVIFVKDKTNMHTLAKAASINERVLFENQKLHNFFYDHITWTKEEDEEKRIGFYIKTFELPFPAEYIFRLCKSFPVTRVLNLLGLSRFIASQNATVYASAAAIGGITIPSSSPEHFLTAGRLFQRLWLRAVNEHFCIQPLAGMAYLALRIYADDVIDLSLRQQTYIQQAYTRAKRIIGTDNDCIAMLFRIGKGEEPTARALRLEPIIEYRTQ